MSMKERNNKITEVMTAVTEEQRRMFNMVMDNIRSFSVSKSGRKSIGIVAIDLSLLYVDMRYQKLRKHKKIKKLIDNWDERKLSPIIVVPHKEECRFAVVDGQGRMIAAKELGYESLQAIVLLDAPEDDYHRVRFEAEIFISQNTETEIVKELEKHPARVLIEDPAAIALENMFEKYNITYTDTRGCREKGVLGSYPTTYQIAGSHGEACLDFIFSIVHNAGWNLEANGYATFVTESLKDVWVNHPRTSDRQKIHKFLSYALKEDTPTGFSCDARSRYKARDTKKACSLFLEDILHDNLDLTEVA